MNHVNVDRSHDAIRYRGIPYHVSIPIDEIIKNEPCEILKLAWIVVKHRCEGTQAEYEEASRKCYEAIEIAKRVK